MLLSCQWRCRGKEGEEDQSGGGWIASGMTCSREYCPGRTLKTELESHKTHRPHMKVGKDEEKEKKIELSIN